eukprot:gene9637-10624_t
MATETNTTQSNQTTQHTNNSDSSYPILFQLQTANDRRNIATDTALSTPYASRKGTTHSQTMKRVRITLALLGIILIVMVIFVLSFYLPDNKTAKLSPGKVEETPEKANIGALEFHVKQSRLLIRNEFSKTAVKIKLNISSSSIRLKQYAGKIIIKQSNITLTLGLDLDKPTEKCWNVSFERTGLNGAPLQSCVDMSNSHWFGVGELFKQTWLLENVKLDMAPFTTHDFAFNKKIKDKVFGNLLEPYLLSSKGVAIFINRDTQLYMSINSPVQNELCFQSKSPPICNTDKITKSNQLLQYTVCTAKDAKQVHKVMLGKFFDKPMAIPDLRMLTEPVWSTWAIFKTNVTQAQVLGYAKAIKSYKLPISHIEIDDKYTTTYGDLDFVPARFPDPVSMAEELHNASIRLTTWVHPFANLDSKALSQGAEYWVKSGGTPGILKWWNGYGAVLDTTNQKGAQWFTNRLKNFKEKYKLDSFKFDAGEVQYLPLYCKLYGNPKNINYFSKGYGEIASRFGGLTEVRTGYGSQKFPVFFRILDRTSCWDLENGLKSVLTATLTFGILGYPFVLPDMVGGKTHAPKPEKELYIRWTQLTVFLPSIQFSIAPWQYDNETVAIVQNALNIRKNISADIVRFARLSARSGEPIVRPLWWQAPFDKVAQASTTEFLVGDKYLVAPVLDKGAKIRVIHIVNGTWQEMFGKWNVITAGLEGKTVKYNVKLQDVFYFKNMHSSEHT